MKIEVIRLFENLVGKVVTDKTTSVLKSGIRRHHQLEARGDTEGAGRIFRTVMKYSEQLKPEGKYDEEEYMIGNLVNRAKRKKK